MMKNYYMVYDMSLVESKNSKNETNDFIQIGFAKKNPRDQIG